MKILGIIPARGGSKGITKKNIVEVNGKPLIAWTIKEALKVPEIDRLICSTDDEDIANVAISYGCEVPFMRPKELSMDRVRVVGSVLHAIEWFENEGICYDITITLPCTSPLRTSEDIKKALHEYTTKNLKSLFGICECERPPYWTYTISDSNKVDPVFGMGKMGQRQTLPKTYRPNGALYINDVKSLKKYKDLKEPSITGFVMEQLHSVDIDSEIDILFAEFLMKNNEILRSNQQKKK